MVPFVTRKAKNGSEDMSVDVLASCLGDVLPTDSFLRVMRSELEDFLIEMLLIDEMLANFLST